MLRILLELVIAPVLVGASTLACRRWGLRIGGLVSAFPAVVGPVLLITAHEHGAVYTSRTAEGTLLGLIALSGFVLAYGRTALRAGWGVSLTAGWTAAALLTAIVGWGGRSLAFPLALVASTVSLGVAHRALPSPGGAPIPAPQPSLPRRDIPLRMGLTGLLVLSLSAATGFFGPLVGGMLAGLPVLASVLAVFSHRQEGPSAVVGLLRGMVGGMAGFVGFCAVIALLIVPLGSTQAFAAAVLTATIVQAVMILAPVRGQRLAET